MSGSVSDEALKDALKQRRKYIETNLDNLTMKTCRKLLEEDLGLPAKSLAGRKEFIQKYVDKIIAHQASKQAKASSVTNLDAASAPAKKKQKAAAQQESELQEDGKDMSQQAKAQPRTSKTIDKVKRIAKAATIKIPPSMYVKSKSLDEVESDMEALLSKHGLSLDCSSHEISKAAARLAKERDLEGIDVSNIVQEDASSSEEGRNSDAAGSAGERDAEGSDEDCHQQDMDSDLADADKATSKAGTGVLDEQSDQEMQTGNTHQHHDKTADEDAQHGQTKKRRAVLYELDDE
ncbi:hypothetical protein WJX79_000885 [Trebouxia sp. C0005]